MNDETKISGTKTAKDWKDLKEKIREKPNDRELWEQAYDFYLERINSRYFKPIKDIRTNDKFIGEGFSIMAILCSLIEFLETTWTGEVYKLEKPNKKNYEYNKGKKKFISFLNTKPPFQDIFDEDLAKEFYKDVRCGILHEASTKNNWIIRVDNKKGKIYELRNNDKVIDRNEFENGIKEYLDFYKCQLMVNSELQIAFIRKMNNIAGLPINTV